MVELGTVELLGPTTRDSAKREFPHRRRMRHLGRRVGKSNEFITPTIETQHLAWQESADCIGVDPEGFFPEGPVERTVLRICWGCPVIAPCLEYALAHPELGGIWGATTSQERQRMRSHIRESG